MEGWYAGPESASSRECRGCRGVVGQAGHCLLEWRAAFRDGSLETNLFDHGVDD